MKVLLPLFFFLQIFTVVWGAQKDSVIAIIEQYIDENDPPLPTVNHLFIKNISDISICKGPSKTYYLTGTTGDLFGVQKGIQIWASRNLIDWNIIGPNKGYVWTFDDNATERQKEIANFNGYNRRGIIAPEIHYINNNFWLTYTNSNSNRSGILRSVNGRAQGPYQQVWPDSMMVNGSNASLFVDSESTIYFIWNGGYIQALKPDLSGFQTTNPVLLGDSIGMPIGGAEVYITNIDGLYCLIGSQYKSQELIGDVGRRFDGVIATSHSILGPYKIQKSTIPHGGAGHLFQDFEGYLWYCFSGTDISSPVYFNPAFLPISNIKGNFLVRHKLSLTGSQSNAVLFVSKEGNNSSGTSWDNAYTSLQHAIDVAPKGAQIWIARGTYDGAVEISLRDGLYLFGGFKGNERAFDQRDVEKNKVIINGKGKIRQVFSILSSSYIRVDGLTIANGNATGGISYQYYGAGMYIIGGGATVRIVNCSFENNIAEQDGGALYVSIGASPTFINCTFSSNISKHNGGAVALYSSTSNGYHFKFYNCTFANNLAYNEGGAIFYDSNQKGHGLLTMINCLLVNNESQLDCGVISVDRSSNLVVLNSTFCFNKGSSMGAAIGNLGKVPGKSRILNSVFYKNAGGSLFNIEGEGESTFKDTIVNYKEVWAQFANCIFYSNKVNAIVERNFDSKLWGNVDQLNKSMMGVDCKQSSLQFTNESSGNFTIKNNATLIKKSASIPFFRYTIDGKTRSEEWFYPGCF